MPRFLVPALFLVLALVLAGCVSQPPSYTCPNGIRVRSLDLCNALERVHNSSNNTLVSSTPTPTPLPSCENLPAPVPTGNISEYRQPVFTCQWCRETDAPTTSSCCTDSFDPECAALGGKTEYWGGAYFPGKACFKRPSDLGKPCATGGECFSGVCDFSPAVNGVCVLSAKEYNGPAIQPDARPYYANYTCPNNRPGACAEIGGRVRVNDKIYKNGRLFESVVIEGVLSEFAVTGCTLEENANIGLVAID